VIELPADLGRYTPYALPSDAVDWTIGLGEELIREQPDPSLPIDPATDPNSRSVIGPDTRHRVDNTAVYPHSAVVAIRFTAGHYCSGVMVGRDTVMTAGHCLYNVTAKTWADILSVRPGRNGNRAPLGSCGIRYMVIFTHFKDTGDANYDIGAIKVSCSEPERLGYFGLYTTTANINGTGAIIYGYPTSRDGQQWGAADGTISSASRNRFYYPTDTSGGQSGSAVYFYPSWGNGGPYAQGVHTVGHGDRNSATRLHRAAFDMIVSVKNAR
jgi:glutamyl endopeptidase